MEKYDYLKAIENDIRNYLNETYGKSEIKKAIAFDRDEFAEKLHDELCVEDSVTGNASGSYTFSTWDAEENLCHNTDLLREALEEFGSEDENILEKGAEWCDVTIRCYLLGQAIDEVIKEYE